MNNLKQNKSKLTISVVLFIVLNNIVLTHAFSQTRSHYINFEVLNVESGLSQNYANCIFQDHLGLIWIGTDDGLNQYDGVKFKHYFKDADVKNAISGNQITGIVEDKNNCLWISTRQEGLNKLNPDRKFFTNYFNNPQLANYLPEINNLQYNGSNKLFFIANNNIYSFNLVSEKLQRPEIMIDTGFVISDFIIDGNNLIIASNKNEIVWYDITKNKISRKLTLAENVSITTIYKIENKIIIGAFENEIFIYYPETGTYKSIFKSIILPDNKNFLNRKDISKLSFTAVDICNANNRIIYISGRESLISLHFFTNTNGNETLTTNYYGFDFAGNCIMSDKSGNIWMGTNGKGIRIFNEKFNNFKANYNFYNFHSLSDIRSIRTIAENSKFLFVGGYYGLLFINKINFEITNFLTQVRQNNPKVFNNPKGVKFEPAIYCLLPDPQWIGVEGYCSGLYKYNLRTKVIKHFAMSGNTNDFKSNFLYDICDDKFGNLWLAGDYGAFKFDRNTEKFTHYQHNTKNNSGRKNYNNFPR